MRRWFTVTALWLTLTAFTPQAGDLLFVVGDDHGSAMEGAITSATAVDLPITHVALAVDSLTIVEAVPRHGVRQTSYSDFAAENPHFMAMRCDDLDVPAAVAKAKSYIGRPYDWAYEPGDSALYCSELVQLCCVDKNGRQVFDSAPMNFKSPDGTVPRFWTELFRTIGKPVPQGLPGTNPAAMARRPGLRKVFTSNKPACGCAAQSRTP